MAEGQSLSVGGAQAVQGGLTAPSAGTRSALQDRLSFTPLDSNSDGVVQPFPISPKLQRKKAKDAPKLSQVKTWKIFSTETT